MLIGSAFEGNQSLTLALKENKQMRKIKLVARKLKQH